MLVWRGKSRQRTPLPVPTTGETMTQDTVLQRQLEFYGELSADIESWQIAHREAMFCRDIEDAVAVGISLYRCLRRRSQFSAREVEAGDAVSQETAKEHAERYRWWLARSKILLSVIDACEAAGYAVQGAERFRIIHRDVSLMCLSVDDAFESIASLEVGKGIPARQAMDELRDRLR